MEEAEEVTGTFTYLYSDINRTVRTKGPRRRSVAAGGSSTLSYARLQMHLARELGMNAR